MNIGKLDKGVGYYGPNSRKRGPINVLKYVNNTIVGIGDALPVKGNVLLTSHQLVGGIRKNIILPTDKRIPNFPRGLNASVTKDVMSGIRRNMRQQRAARMTKVKLSNGFNGLDVAQSLNLITPRYKFENTLVRGGHAALNHNVGPKRKENWFYRMATMPVNNPLSNPIDTVNNISPSQGVSSSAPSSPVTISMDTVKNNPRIMVFQTPGSNSVKPADTSKVNPTILFVGALVLAWMVFKR